LAESGERAVLFERDEMGGTCETPIVRWPKTLFASAHTVRLARNDEPFGIITGPVQSKQHGCALSRMP
jgi:hypothetical protein